MKIKVWIKTNRQGSKVSTEIEVDDNASDEQIEDEAREAAFDMVEWSWEPVEQDDDDAR